MSDSEQILDAIETRLIEARGEITALQAARSALAGSTHSTRSRPRANSRSSGPRRAPMSRSTTRTAPSNGAASLPVAAAPKAKDVQAAKRSPSVRPPRARPLGDDAIESLLRERADGLSAAALTKLTGASHARVTARLRGLEQAGQARSSGTRRTSLWRMVTNEERVAERAAELEKAQGLNEVSNS